MKKSLKILEAKKIGELIYSVHVTPYSSPHALWKLNLGRLYFVLEQLVYVYA